MKDTISKDRIKSIITRLWNESSSYEDFKRSIFAWVNYELEEVKND